MCSTSHLNLTYYILSYVAVLCHNQPHTLLHINHHTHTYYFTSLTSNPIGAKQKLAAGNAIKTPYLKVVGIQIDANGAGRMSTVFTPSEVSACVCVKSEGLFVFMCPEESGVVVGTGGEE